MPNGGTWIGGGNLIQTVEYGKAAIAPVLVKEGYNANTWDANFNEVKDNLTVNAEWTIKTFTVTFKSDNVQIGEAQTID